MPLPDAWPALCAAVHVRAEAAAAATPALSQQQLHLRSHSSPIDPVLVLHRSLDDVCGCVHSGGEEEEAAGRSVVVCAYVQEAGVVTKFCIGRRLSHVPVACT